MQSTPPIQPSSHPAQVTDAMSKLHVGVMRWAISLWVGQVAATAAIIAAMFRIYSP
jgi:hypothetical protein